MALDLSHKVGPFSVGAWAGIGAAGVGLGLVARRLVKPKTAPAAPAPDTSNVDTIGGFTPAGGVVPTVTGTTAAGDYTPARKAPTDNAEWSKLALEYLIADGQDPVTSQQAIAKALMGDPITPQMAAVLSIALRAIGQPPDGMPALNVQAPASSTPTPAPAQPTPYNGGNAVRARARLNALRNWFAFVGQNVSDWPPVASDGPMTTPDVRAATIGLVTRANEARQNQGKPLLPTDGVYSSAVDAEANALATFFHLSY